MKKLVLFVASIALILSTNAQDTIASGECGANGSNLTWVLTTDSVLTIGGNGAMPEYGYIYSEGVPPWYFYQSSIITISIGDSVKNLGQYAFSGCPNLKFVIIPNGVTTISHYVFANCYRLSSITIGRKITLIGDYVFNNCISLTKIICKSEVPCKIYENTFYHVSEGAVVYIPCYAALRYADSDWGKVFTTFIEDCVDIEQLTMDNEQLKIYPNPTNGQLHITMGHAPLWEDAGIEIFNVVGQKLLSASPNPSEGGEQPSPFGGIKGGLTIDVSSLADGMYFLKINNKVTKFIKL